MNIGMSNSMPCRLPTSTNVVYYRLVHKHIRKFFFDGKSFSFFKSTTTRNCKIERTVRFMYTHAQVR
jgi:hypothetical protein